MNCPKVSVDARWPRTNDDTNGLRDVCIRALPMPNSEKAMSATARFSVNIGNSSDTTVTTKESSTVFFRPILFISTPVGTEKIRNQKKTSDGMMLAMVLLSPRSSLT